NMKRGQTVSGKTVRIRIWILLLAILAAGVAILATGIQAQDSAKPDNTPTQTGSSWLVRCDDIKDGEKVTGQYCEMAQNISVTQKDADPATAQRLVEMAIGYAPAEKGKATAVVILPLGILVNEDLVLEIDGRKELDFEVRYCEATGCIASFNLSEKEMGKLAKGAIMTLKTTAATGRAVAIEM